MKKTILALLASAFVATAAHAAFPDKPVTITVPFPPGGSTDMLARIMTPKMSEKLGQPVIVENKPGATGAIGAAQIKRAAPDGYNVLCASIGVWAANPFLQKNLAYDPAKDFDLLMVAVKSPNILVVNPNVPAKDVKELIAYLKQKNGKVSFPSSGAGSSDHLSIALFWMITNTTGIHVPYKGGGPAIADLVAGHAEVSFQNLNNVIQHIKAGKLRALATTSEKRSPLLPDVPTMVELGYRDMVVTSWQALGAPKGLPADVKAKLHESMVAALKDPETAKKLTDPGFEIVASTPEEFSRFLNAELAKWKTVIEVGKITLD
ncbi:Bug family tripartite tricarboxylate transporter substrate binding protein [Propionivibrio dicarboxylicus]|uniref:Tripartite-type tricarboxylate transporter, receptor component TctC n=1 Tax=Propionivibrio dicarboxylicus TaxID=83767 RepID=A0A1G7WE82_9RHOO|nr:tripartite tricarboxylate transporter substrate binding protein [Propionivibrio dicarboxylicus]SDG70335.1 Tripartite-type tricarboxylate transporter, receptor component TctC [Propionivibrio dicarboxylicus]